ncbi:Uncharacterised protein [Mycobacteroides abscessus subsp. abscessus]|nr:Uncharacterised protein [Mycobacteroides abscessus subsp. abscessus]
MQSQPAKRSKQSKTFFLLKSLKALSTMQLKLHTTSFQKKSANKVCFWTAFTVNQLAMKSADNTSKLQKRFATALFML